MTVPAWLRPANQDISVPFCSRLSVFHNESCRGRNRTIRSGNSRNHPKVCFETLGLYGAADIAAARIEKLDVRVLRQQSFSLRPGIGAIAAAGDRGSNELRTDRRGTGFVKIDFEIRDPVR